MAATDEIHQFANHWLCLFRDDSTEVFEVENGFPEACFSVGFQMDCGKSFEEAYPGTQDNQKLEAIITNVTDINLLGAAIFSKFRYITHWSYGNSLLSDENRSWFMTALRRLVQLTDDEKTNR